MNFQLCNSVTHVCQSGFEWVWSSFLHHDDGLVGSGRNPTVLSYTCRQSLSLSSLMPGWYFGSKCKAIVCSSCFLEWKHIRKPSERELLKQCGVEIGTNLTGSDNRCNIFSCNATSDWQNYIKKMYNRILLPPRFEPKRLAWLSLCQNYLLLTWWDNQANSFSVQSTSK